MAKPEDDTDTEDLARRDADKVRERIKAAEPEEPVPDEPENPTELDDDPLEPAQPTRQEKKRARYQDMRDRQEQAERDNQALRAQLAQQAQFFEELRAQRQPQPGNGKPADEHQAELDAIYREESVLTREVNARHAAKQLTQADLDKYEEEARKLQERKYSAIARREMRQNQGQDQGQALTQFLQLQYPDVYANRDAAAWASTRYQQLKIEGKPAGVQTLAEAMTDTRKRYRLAGGAALSVPAPSAQQRAKYEGAPRGGGGGPSSGAEDEIQVPRNATYLRMAKTTYQHLHRQMKGKTLKEIEDAQWKMWVQGPGKRHLKKMREQRAQQS